MNDRINYLKGRHQGPYRSESTAIPRLTVHHWYLFTSLQTEFLLLFQQHVITFLLAPVTAFQQRPGQKFQQADGQANFGPL